MFTSINYVLYLVLDGGDGDNTALIVAVITMAIINIGIILVVVVIIIAVLFYKKRQEILSCFFLLGGQKSSACKEIVPLLDIAN